jgi:hypothetical protein
MLTEPFNSPKQPIRACRAGASRAECGAERDAAAPSPHRGTEDARNPGGRSNPARPQRGAHGILFSLHILPPVACVDSGPYMEQGEET